MTQHKNEPDNTNLEQTLVDNPYDIAEPIRQPRRTNHRKASQQPPESGHRVRSRTVQSARDSAARRRTKEKRDEDDQREDASSQEAESGKAKSTPSSKRSRTKGQKVRKPRPVPRQGESSRKGKRATGKRRPTSRPPRPDGLRTVRRKSFGMLVAALLVAICALGALLYWMNRPVPVTVNGNAAEIRVGSKLEDVVGSQGLSIKPGNYVSVSGDVLESEGGHAFSAAVNGRALSQDEISAYRIEGTEAIDITDGEDIIEEYTATSQPIAPQLQIEGEGTSIEYVSQWGRNGTMETRTGSTSGETADVVAEEPQDCVVKCSDPILKGDKKFVALTFNDGPADPYTAQYLDICKERGVKATFFCLDDNLKQYPDLVQRIKDEGHELGCQTLTHSDLSEEEAETVRTEISGGAEAVRKAAGVQPTHLRPPSGNFTEENWLDSGGLVTAVVRWSADSQDWSLPGSEAIVANSLDGIHSGSIILMHDGGGDRSQTVEALPQIIERLQGEGYSFVTVGELLKSVASVPDEVSSGTQAMPDWASWPTELAGAQSNDS